MEFLIIIFIIVIILFFFSRLFADKQKVEVVKNIEVVKQKVEVALRGKQIAVLGQRETGKTTLLEYMQTGEINREYNQTLVPKKIDLYFINKNNPVSRFPLRSTSDVPGSKDDRGFWKELFIESDFILYLVRVDQLFALNQLTKARLEEDIIFISKTLSKEKLKKEIFIIGTHCDQDPKYPEYRNQLGSYRDKFRELESVRKMIDTAVVYRQQVKIVLGSLDNEKNANKLIKDIFQTV